MLRLEDQEAAMFLNLSFAPDDYEHAEVVYSTIFPGHLFVRSPFSWFVL